MVKMPTALMKKTLRDLPFGASTWTVPWALYLDGEGECWLNGQYSQGDGPMGTVQMLVTHTEDGYWADITRCGYYSWSEGHGVAQWGDPLPVARLIR